MFQGGRMARIAALPEPDDGLAIRAAWLHFAGGLTQSQVAARLGVSGAKAHRLIARASRSGAVKIFIDGEVAECVNAEMRLSARFGLDYCEVVPDIQEAGLPLRALGLAGAKFFRREIEALSGGVIGMGHGRTILAAIRAMPRAEAPGLRFVSLLGGLTRNFAANPHDVMQRLAERTGADAYMMPVPFFANTAADREVLLAQRGVGDVRTLADRADLMVAGIGTALPDTQLVASDVVDVKEVAEVRRCGAEGELLGHFIDRDGRPVETQLSARTISPPLETLRARRLVAIAGGAGKVRAIRATLMSGLLNGLITDEVTALALVEDDQF